MNTNEKIYSHLTCVRTSANTFQAFAHWSVERRARGALSCMQACEHQEDYLRCEQQEGLLRCEQYIQSWISTYINISIDEYINKYQNEHIRHRACATACHELGFNDLYIYAYAYTYFGGNDDLNNDMHTHVFGVLNVVKGTPPFPSVVTTCVHFGYQISASFLACIFDTFRFISLPFWVTFRHRFPQFRHPFFEHRFRIDFAWIWELILVSLLMFFLYPYRSHMQPSKPSKNLFLQWISMILPFRETWFFMIFMIFPVTCFCIEFSFVLVSFWIHSDTFSVWFFIFWGCFFFMFFSDGVFLDFPRFPDRNWTQKSRRLGLTPTGLPPKCALRRRHRSNEIVLIDLE